MSTETNSKPRYETVMNGIRREASKMREGTERLSALANQLAEAGHPAPADRLAQSVTALEVALEYLRGVFRDF